MAVHVGRILNSHQRRDESSLHLAGSPSARNDSIAEEALLTREFVALLHAREALRQQQEMFEFKMLMDRRWERIRLIMAYSALILMIAINALCVWTLVDHKTFPDAVLAFSASAISVHSLGFVFWVWRTVFSRFVGSASNAANTVTHCACHHDKHSYRGWR
jgi:hypothetical protein